MTRLAGVAAELVAMRRIFTHRGTDMLIVFDTNTQHSVFLSLSLSPSLPPSLPLSFSLSHTHTDCPFMAHRFLDHPVRKL